MKRKSFAYSMMFLFALSAVAAQAPRVKSGHGQTARRPRQEPCWQVAGISKAAMEKHKSLEQSAHSQVQAVCADPSLTPQQKREKIREIHEQTHQQAESLFTPQQHQALHQPGARLVCLALAQRHVAQTLDGPAYIMLIPDRARQGQALFQ